MQFELLNKAYELLMDGERRAHFDKTGEIREVVPDNRLAVIVNALSPLFDRACLTAVQNGHQPHQVQLLALIRNFVDEEIGKLSTHMAQVTETREKLECLRGRFTMTAGTTNIFERLIMQRLDAAEKNFQKAEAAMAAWRDVKAFLDDYSFDFEVIQQIQQVVVMRY